MFKTSKKLLTTVLLTLSLLSITNTVFADSKFFSFDGLWNLEGYGMIAEIEGKSITFYEYTSISCLDAGSMKLEQPDNGYLYIFDYQLLAGKTEDTRLFRHTLGYEIYGTAIDSLPELCTAEKTKPTPINTFNVFWHTFNEHYAFFELHGVDWQAQYNIFHPQVTLDTSDEALFTILSKMIEPLKDGHTSLIGNADGQEYSPGNVPEWLEGFQTIRSVIFDTYLQAEPTFLANRRIFYSELTNNIAYLNIVSMMGYYTPLPWQDYSHFKDQTELNKAMDEVFSAINNPKYDALVLDIRFNGGGSDNFSAQIASYFADKTRTIYNKSYWYKDSFSSEQAIAVKSHDTKIFDKPIILLTSNLTASAAEIFTVIMQTYPNVTLIGEATAGEFSDVFERTLPNGWSFGLSNERYVTTKGINYEKTGVPPAEEILMRIEDFQAGNDLILDRAMEILVPYTEIVTPTD